jgi:hypothetical protein
MVSDGVVHWISQVVIVFVRNIVSSTLLLSLAGATVVMVDSDTQKTISHATSDNAQAPATKSEDPPSWIEKAADPTVSIPLFLALVGALYFVTSRFYDVHQELGRERFLHTIASSIDDVLSERLDPRLDKVDKHIEWLRTELQEVRRKLSNIQTRHYAIESKLTEDEEIIDEYFEKVDDELSEILSEISGTQIRVRIYRNRRANARKGHTSSWYARYIEPTLEDSSHTMFGEETETRRISGQPPEQNQDS